MVKIYHPNLRDQSVSAPSERFKVDSKGFANVSLKVATMVCRQGSFLDCDGVLKTPKAAQPLKNADVKVVKVDVKAEEIKALKETVETLNAEALKAAETGEDLKAEIKALKETVETLNAAESGDEVDFVPDSEEVEKAKEVDVSEMGYDDLKTAATDMGLEYKYNVSKVDLAGMILAAMGDE